MKKKFNNRLGFTLIEMLVVTFIFVVVMSLSSIIITSILKAKQRNLEQLKVNQETRNAIETITREAKVAFGADVRDENALIVNDPNSLTIQFSDRLKKTYSLDGESIKMSTQNYDPLDITEAQYYDIVLVLDMSTSMRYPIDPESNPKKDLANYDTNSDGILDAFDDGTPGGIHDVREYCFWYPSDAPGCTPRINVVRTALNNFIDLIEGKDASSGHIRLGIVSFSDCKDKDNDLDPGSVWTEPVPNLMLYGTRQVLDLTSNYNDVRNIINGNGGSIKPIGPSGGTCTGLGIKKANEMLVDKAPIDPAIPPKRLQALISDGCAIEEGYTSLWNAITGKDADDKIIVDVNPAGSNHSDPAAFDARDVLEGYPISEGSVDFALQEHISIDSIAFGHGDEFVIPWIDPGNTAGFCPGTLQNIAFNSFDLNPDDGQTGGQFILPEEETQAALDAAYASIVNSIQTTTYEQAGLPQETKLTSGDVKVTNLAFDPGSNGSAWPYVKVIMEIDNSNLYPAGHFKYAKAKVETIISSREYRQ